VSEAIEQFRFALAADPHYADARYNLGNALASQEKWEQAAAEFRQVLAEHPAESGARDHLLEALLLWSRELIAANNLEQTVACYRQAIALKPDDAGLHANLGTALARLGRFAEAIPQFETALSIDPSLEPAKQSLSAARSMLQAHQ
jgi:tetratricopeptide (TPR) repeat protein